MSIHQAQTDILVWLWDNDHPVMDREAMEAIQQEDGPWMLTFRGMEMLDAMQSKARKKWKPPHKLMPRCDK